MRRASSVFVFVFVILGRVYAQTPIAQSTPETSAQLPTTVSREDLQRVTEEMKKATQDAVRQVGKRSAEELSREREAATKRQEEIIRRQDEDRRASEERSRAEEEKTRAQIAAAASLRQREEAKTRSVMIYGAVGVSAFLAVLAVSWFVVVRRRPTPVEVRVVRDHDNNNDGILVDPDIPALREYSLRNEGINPVQFYLTVGFGDNAVKRLCEAQLAVGMDPVIVNVDGKTCTIGWQNRQKKVLRLLEDKKLQAVS